MCLLCVCRVCHGSARCLPGVCCVCHVSAICLPCLPCVCRVCYVSSVSAMCLSELEKPNIIDPKMRSAVYCRNLRNFFKVQNLDFTSSNKTIIGRDKTREIFMIHFFTFMHMWFDWKYFYLITAFAALINICRLIAQCSSFLTSEL